MAEPLRPEGPPTRGPSGPARQRQEREAQPLEAGRAGAAKSTRYDLRPVDPTPLHTADLPATPVRDRNIPATAWIEAPDDLLQLGADLPGQPVADYKRRIGAWLLWRAGPAAGADARYWAGRADDTTVAYTFHLFPDGNGDGIGPSGQRHTRFRAWKEDLRG